MSRSAVSLNSSTGTTGGVRIRRSAGKHRTRPISASQRRLRQRQLSAWRNNAVNLWTAGCAGARLTAQARSPMDKPGKMPCISPTLPKGRRLSTSFTALQQQQGLILIPGKGKTFSRLRALAYSSRNLSRRPGPPQCFGSGNGKPIKETHVQAKVNNYEAT